MNLFLTLIESALLIAIYAVDVQGRHEFEAIRSVGVVLFGVMGVLAFFGGIGLVCSEKQQADYREAHERKSFVWKVTDQTLTGAVVVVLALAGWGWVVTAYIFWCVGVMTALRPHQGHA